MAKVKRPKRGNIVVDHEIGYDRPKSTEPEKYARSLAKQILTNRTLSQMIVSQRQYYADLLRLHVIQDDSGSTLLNMGDGWKPYRLAATTADDIDAVFDGVRGMDVLYLLEWHTAKKRLPADILKIVQCAFLAGFTRGAVEYVRALEPLANDGLLFKAGRHAPKGGLTPDEKIRAKIAFDKAKATATDNAAVDAAMRTINTNRAKPVSKSTIEREVGVRQ